MSDFRPPTLGWCPDWPDVRDFLLSTPQVLELLEKLRVRGGSNPSTSSVDLSEYFGPVRKQCDHQASPAQACVAVLEYFRRRTTGNRSSLSVRFVDVTTRKLSGLRADANLNLRSTWKCINCFGVPEFRHCHDGNLTNTELDAFQFGICCKFAGLQYFRPTTYCQPGRLKLQTIKSFLLAEIPIVFGFAVPNSISDNALIDYRPAYSSALGGQVVVAVGFDDHLLGTNQGCLRIRNSWGKEWGENGYGWLPYEFVSEGMGLATDFWTALSPAWAECEYLSHPFLCDLRNDCQYL